MGRGVTGSTCNAPTIDKGTLALTQARPVVQQGLRPATTTQLPRPGVIPLMKQLPAAVDGVPELAGAGIVLLAPAGPQVVRKPAPPQGRYIVIHVGGTSQATLTPNDAGPDQASAVWDEAANLGLNCGGAVLSWIGVVATGATAPASGGLTLAGSVLMWGGAVAGTGQCVASGVRLYNEMTDGHEVNRAMATDPTYERAMAAADAVGLAGAGVGLKGVMQTAKAVRGYGVIRSATTRMSRPARKVLSEALELSAAGKRASSPMINLVVKQRLLDGLGGVVGVGGSAYGGLLKELSIWAFTPGEPVPR